MFILKCCGHLIHEKKRRGLSFKSENLVCGNGRVWMSWMCGVPRLPWENVNLWLRASFQILWLSLKNSQCAVFANVSIVFQIEDCFSRRSRRGPRFTAVPPQASLFFFPLIIHHFKIHNRLECYWLAIHSKRVWFFRFSDKVLVEFGTHQVCNTNSLSIIFKRCFIPR